VLLPPSLRGGFPPSSSFEQNRLPERRRLSIPEGRIEPTARETCPLLVCYHINGALRSAHCSGGYSSPLVLPTVWPNGNSHLAATARSAPSLDRAPPDCAFRTFTRRLPLFRYPSPLQELTNSGRSNVSATTPTPQCRRVSRKLAELPLGARARGSSSQRCRAFPCAPPRP